MSVSLRHLKSFVATPERCRVSLAATEPSISQPAVTAANKDLKAMAGTPVLSRTETLRAMSALVVNGQNLSILSDMIYRPWSLEGQS